MLNQTGVDAPFLHMTKGSNGYLISVAHPTGKHQIVSLIDPVDAKTQDTPQIILYAIAQKLNQPPIKPFFLVDGNKVDDPDCICRTCPIKHAVDKIISQGILSSVPSTVYQAPKLGELFTRVLVDEDAHSLDSAFMQLVSTAKNSKRNNAVYQRPIELSPELQRLLMLEHLYDQNVLLDRCKNGIVCFTKRPCGSKTFHCLVNSAQFFAKKLPNKPAGQSKVHIITLKYAPEAPFVNLVDHNKDAREAGDLALNLNFQDNYNRLEKIFRVQNQHATDTQHFQQYLDLIKRVQLCPPDSNEIDEIVDEFKQMGLLPHDVDFEDIIKQFASQR